VPSNPLGYAMFLAGSSLEVRDSCFYNNTFSGWAPIRAFSGSPVTQGNNYVDGLGTTTCKFIAKSEREAPDLLADVECVDAALNQSCPLEPSPPNKTDPDTSSAFSLLGLGQIFLPSSLTVFTILAVAF
jgi:hypothetical protein